MKKFILSFLLLLLITNLFAENSQTAVTNSGEKVILYDSGIWEYAPEQIIENFNFRKSVWGMTKQNVIDSENSEPIHETDVALFFEVSVANMEAWAIYIFSQQQLVRSKYYFIEDHTNDNLYIDDYNNLVEILTSKYGDPIDSTTYWSDDLYKSDYSDWGFAISLGDMYMRTDWSTDETLVSSNIGGDGYEIEVEIYYESYNLAHLEDQQKQSQNQNDF